jgi:prepilin-type N-terminal cleavage/methylation domain-containing protein
MNGKAGYSLMEIIVVLGILGVIAAFSLFASVDMFRSYLFRGERDIFISNFQKVRSRAMNNICLGGVCTDGKPHGVHIEADSYTLFQGAAYNPSDSINEQFEINDNAMITGSTIPLDIVFSQLSGDATPEGSVTIADDAGHSSTVTINAEGRIFWTN